MWQSVADRDARADHRTGFDTRSMRRCAPSSPITASGPTVTPSPSIVIGPTTALDECPLVRWESWSSAAAAQTTDAAGRLRSRQCRHVEQLRQNRQLRQHHGAASLASAARQCFRGRVRRQRPDPSRSPTAKIVNADQHRLRTSLRRAFRPALRSVRPVSCLPSSKRPRVAPTRARRVRQ